MHANCFHLGSKIDLTKIDASVHLDEKVNFTDITLLTTARSDVVTTREIKPTDTLVATTRGKLIKPVEVVENISTIHDLGTF